MEHIIANAPIEVRIEHTSKIKLALFLTGIKTTIESAAPGAATWKTKKHGDFEYVAISTDEIGQDNFNLYYAVTQTA